MPNTAPATVTYTGTTGAGQALTAAVFSNVTNVEYDFMKNTMKVTYDNGRRIVYLDYSASVTITQVIASGLTTITVS